VPQHVIDEQEEKLCVWRQKADIQAMSRVITNAYKLYCKSRPSPSSESTKRAKSVGDIHIAVHPMFSSSCSEVEADQAKLLDAMKTYRPHTTIFEINSTSRTQAFAVMKQKRQQHEGVINRKHKNTDVIHQRSFSASNVEAISDGNNDTTNTTQRMLDSVTDVEVNDAFTTVFAPKSKSDPYLEVERREERKANRKKKMRKASEIDRDNFLPYRPKDYQSEQGLGLLTSFEKDANNAVLDLTGDDEQEMRKSRSRMIWDRKKKKFVQATGLEKGGRKLRTESGKIISSSYKTNAYDQWLEKNKLKHAPDDSDGEDASQEETGRKWNSGRGRGRGKHWGGRQREEGGSVMRRKFGGKGNKRQDGAENPTGRGKQRFRRELREKSQIVKQRVQKAAKLAYQAHRADQKHNRNGARKGGRGSFRGRGKGRPHSN
jgi:ATP-dependent RNA helicase DDX54/DBP10